MRHLIKRLSSLKLTTKILLIALTFWGVVLTHSVVSAYQISYSNPQNLQGATSSENGLTLIAGRPVNLTNFQRIRLSTSADLNWKTGHSSQCTTDKSSKDITINVESNTLIIKNIRKKKWFQKSAEKITLDCTSPYLERLKIEGAADVYLSDLKSQDLFVEINGVSQINAKGEVESFTGEISGAGEMQLSELVINRADLKINGTGHFKATKAKQIKVEINGTGSIDVSSQAKILSQDINGVGSINTVD